MTKSTSDTSWLISNGPSQKILGIPYGIKKGWLLAFELMPGHQDNMITAADNKTDIREAYIINKAIEVDIIAAGSAQTRPLIKKIPAGDSGDSNGDQRQKEKHTHPRP
jgi:hypothetical protein